MSKQKPGAGRGHEGVEAESTQKLCSGERSSEKSASSGEHAQQPAATWPGCCTLTQARDTTAAKKLTAHAGR